MEVLRFRARREDVPLMEAAPLEAGQVKSSLSSQTFSYKEFSKVQISLLGRYQIENAVLALETIRALRMQTLQGHPIIIPDKAVLQGMKNAVWPGRFQIVARKPIFIADGAHNRDGAARLAESLQYYFPQKHMIFIMGILRDKEQEEIVKATVPLADQVLTISTKGARELFGLRACGNLFPISGKGYGNRWNSGGLRACISHGIPGGCYRGIRFTFLLRRAVTTGRTDRSTESEEEGKSV